MFSEEVTKYILSYIQPKKETDIALYPPFFLTHFRSKRKFKDLTTKPQSKTNYYNFSSHETDSHAIEDYRINIYHYMKSLPSG